jgi:hypothetical protein
MSPGQPDLQTQELRVWGPAMFSNRLLVVEGKLMLLIGEDFHCELELVQGPPVGHCSGVVPCVAL